MQYLVVGALGMHGWSVIVRLVVEPGSAPVIILSLRMVENPALANQANQKSAILTTAHVSVVNFCLKFLPKLSDKCGANTVFDFQGFD